MCALGQLHRLLTARSALTSYSSKEEDRKRVLQSRIAKLPPAGRLHREMFMYATYAYALGTDSILDACYRLALRTTATAWETMMWLVLLPRLMASASYARLKAFLGWEPGADKGNSRSRLVEHQDEEMMADTVRSLQAQYSACQHSLSQLSVAHQSQARQLVLLRECKLHCILPQEPA